MPVLPMIIAVVTVQFAGNISTGQCLQGIFPLGNACSRPIYIDLRIAGAGL